MRLSAYCAALRRVFRSLWFRVPRRWRNHVHLFVRLLEFAHLGAWLLALWT